MYEYIIVYSDAEHSTVRLESYTDAAAALRAQEELNIIWRDVPGVEVRRFSGASMDELVNTHPKYFA